jgi:hypothetical protein
MQSTAKPSPSTSALRCRVCGACVFVTRDPGVHSVVIEHETDCAFMAAVDANRARLWTEANGFPLEALSLDPLGMS